METPLCVKPVQTDLDILYKRAFPPVARLVKRYGGAADDAKDVFHETLLTWLELPEEKRAAIGNQTAYLVTMARNDWFRRIEKTEKERDAARMPADETISVSNELYNLLATAGKKCMDLLQAFYYEDRPAAHIAKTFGLAGAHSASAQKYKCLEKLRHLVKTTNRRKEDFYEN